MDPLPPTLLLGLRHVALNVRSVRRSMNFYSTVLGMKLEWMPDEQNAYLTSGTDNLALHELPEGHQPGPVQLIHHIGFLVRQPQDVDEWAERIRANGIHLAAEPKTHRRRCQIFLFP